VLNLRQDGLDLRAWLLLIAALVSTFLVVVRQVVAFVDSSRLLIALDAEVKQREQLAARLEYLAFHDSLTGLANRALFTVRLEAALERVGRTGCPVAVLVVDLDDFKPVNDKLGHRAGDLLLNEVAIRLTNCARDTDTVARIGGDEFGILVEESSPEAVAVVAERVVRAIAAPITVAGEVVGVGASVGVAIDRGDGHRADELLHDADSAMYVAKKQGGSAYQISKA
jgi:diguanylate cyclase (GGDEF)-like protein